jgi:hypothetical protein
MNKTNSDDACAGAPEGELSVQGAWVRPATAGQTTTALYGVICNRTGAPQALVSVGADGVAAVVELHETRRTAEGQVSMAQIGRLDVPANGATLAPGGAHVMLIGLGGALEEGASANVVFNFESGVSIPVAAPVRAGDASASGHQH